MLDTTVIPSINRADYDAHPALRSSLLKQFHESPLHFWHARENPTPPTDAMTLGTLVHAAVLEPKVFDERVRVMPELNLRKKDDRAVRDQMLDEHGEWAVTRPTFDQIRAIRDRALRDPEVASVLARCTCREHPHVGVTSGLLTKCLLDAWNGQREHALVIDVKTSRDPSPEAFERDLWTRRYLLQAAFYAEVMDYGGVSVTDFRFVVLGTAEPYATGVYKVDRHDLSLMRKRVREWCAELRALLEAEAEASAKGERFVWPSYGTRLLKLPGWAYGRLSA